MSGTGALPEPLDDRFNNALDDMLQFLKDHVEPSYRITENTTIQDVAERHMSGSAPGTPSIPESQQWATNSPATPRAKSSYIPTVEEARAILAEMVPMWITTTNTAATSLGWKVVTFKEGTIRCIQNEGDPDSDQIELHMDDIWQVQQVRRRARRPSPGTDMAAAAKTIVWVKHERMSLFLAPETDTKAWDLYIRLSRVWADCHRTKP